MRLIAYTVKGLEDTTEKELLKTDRDINVVQKSDKVIIFDFSGALEDLTGLRTVNDIGLYISDLENINLNNLPNLLKTIESIRPLGNTFSVTSSIAKTDKDKEQVTNKVIEELTKYGLIYEPNDRNNLDFRVFLNDEIGFLAIRLTKEPLSKRDYEVGNYLGALKPTIAAAMIQMSTDKLPKESRVVDNFCGSGTILCESLLVGFPVYGGDISSEAVTLTYKRLRLLGSKKTENIRVQDATKTKWNSKYFDCAISNLPWDKQHEVSHITELYSNTIKEYKRILKSNFRLCIICHKPDLLIKHIKKEFGEVSITRADIGYLGQTPSIVLVTNL